MAKASLRIKGIEGLKRKLLERKEILIKALGMQLAQLGEQCVTYSKDNKGYRDRTANLKNSISYALYLDGELISSAIGQLPKPNETKHGQQGVQSALEKYAQQNNIVSPTGYTIIVVAGMEYGKYVEDKGYNVLHLTKYFLRDEMVKIFKEVAERIREQ